jgi:hypothetical protein
MKSRPITRTKRRYGFVGSKKNDEEFISSLEKEWLRRGEYINIYKT